ncbi:hypothetical protein ASJ78_03674 [Serratia marcescens]|nr:hypothetical protein ASJ78_03674 [Serratia marcescens]
MNLFLHFAQLELFGRQREPGGRFPLALKSQLINPTGDSRMADINRLCGLNVGIAVVDNQFCCFELKFCREMFCHWVTCGVGEVRISPSDQVASISVPLHKDVMFVTDLSGMSLLEIILWPAKQLVKILTWLLNGFNWPYDQRDMYGQPMTIKYAPKMTTCTFDNAGLAVKLPTLGISQITQGAQNGLTPFTLNFSCQNRQSGGTADRDINMFLSSNNLLSSDNTVLIDKSAEAAKGIGIRLVKTASPNNPVTLSLSSVTPGAATSLFHVGTGNALDAQFSIGMAAYYYPYSPTAMSSGGINTSATLNIIYK